MFLFLAAGCGPTVRPDGPASEPTPTVRMERPPIKTTNGRHVVIGELCPAAAAGRPAVLPLVMRNVTWTDKVEEIASIVEHGSTPRFVVIGATGKQAGVFDTVGLEDGAPGTPPIANGTYVGAAPCVGADGKTEDPACARATGGCGLALGEIARSSDDPPDTPKFQLADFCVANNALVVDIDGDGAPETFAIDEVLDGIHSPTAEWTASAKPGAACSAGKPQLYDAPVAITGKDAKPDPRAGVLVSVLAVTDLDGDGRKEVVLLVQFPTVRSLVVYSPLDMAQRLELVGEGAANITPPM